MNEITLIINNKTVTGKKGETLLKIALDNGIEIPNLCYNSDLSVFGACGLCLVESKGSPRLLRACATIAADGMEIETASQRVVRARTTALELLMADHIGDCIGPCTLSCPAGTDCQGYLKQIALGNDHEAVKIIKKKLPIPASIGRICPAPCQTACRRNLVEEQISIAHLKYFAADNDLNSGAPYKAQAAPKSGKKVCIIGGGPAGLTAAYYLMLKGHDTIIYDAMPKMGGMLRYGIPEYRLPDSVLDAEITLLETDGIVLKNNVSVGKDVTLEELRKEYDAVFVAIGAWLSTKLGCAGDDMPGVLSGIEFLKDTAMGIKTDMGSRVAVIGGGNTAIDVCRTAVRLGAKEVYIIYRRTRSEMPAEDIEIKEAMEEGVEFKFLCAPAEIIGKNDKAAAIKLQIMELGEKDENGRRSPVPIAGKFETIEIDTVIAAIGQIIDANGFESLALNKRGNIDVDENTFMTSINGVFAAGDAVTKGAGIAIEAVGEAGIAAESINAYLSGKTFTKNDPFLSKRTMTADDYIATAKIARVQMPHVPAAERKTNFKEVNLGLPQAAARKEAERCLECGCHDYGDCKLIENANLCEIAPQRLSLERRPFDKEQLLVCIERDQNKCILCGLCVRACYEDAKAGIIDFEDRGYNTVIKPEFENTDAINICKNCLKCERVCPTGALKVIS